MLAMQYSIQLPENYELERIHQRVSERSKLFDALPGLAHKSYLLDGQDMVYAPFYIWSDVEEAQKFLFDDLFTGVIKAFSRPRVRSWFTLLKDYGNTAVKPAFCLKETDVIAPEEKLENIIASERKDHEAKLTNPALYFRCIAFDSDRWEIIRYSLWEDKKSAPKPVSDCVQEYEVLHVSDV